MPRVFVLAAVVALLSGGSVMAQMADAPRMGFVEDRVAHRLHAMLGVPGAAHVGPALELGDSVASEAVSPRGDYALLVVGEERKPGIWTPQAGIRVLEIAPPAPDIVALSPDGAAAALYYRGENVIQTISNLPGAPRAATAIRLIPPESPIRDIAISDDGRLVLATTGDSFALVISAAGQVNRLRLSTSVLAIAFGVNSHDAVVAGDSEAILVRRVELPTEEIGLPANDLGIVTAAAITPGGQQIVLAAPGSGKVALVNLEVERRSVIALPCACAPVELARIGAGYRLTPFSGGVSWMLDISSKAPRILSVPPVTSSEVQP